ncbi:hypothetical protein CsSME_00010416 [Camellia sinensis var. sinensis]
MLGSDIYDRRARLRELVTQVGALGWLDLGSAQKVEPLVAACWPARSKWGVGLRGPGESLGFEVPKVEGTA